MREDAIAAIEVETASISFDEFYRLHYRNSLAVARALTRDRGRAEEVVQDAFLAAQRRWASVSRYDRPDLWLRRVVINWCISLRGRLGNEVIAIGRFVGRSARSNEESAGTDEELWRAVRRLPRSQAAVIVLVYVDDMTIERAADTLGISPSTAKTHLRRAKDRLGTWLSERNDND